jgi:sigma-B regulation protein RsbU (phosphoserine phosphatase)
LDKGGIILGIMKTMIPYEEGEVLIEVGDVLVLFTDGVSEAMDAKGEEWGEEPLEEIGLNHLTESSGSILSRIVDAVKEHGKNTQQSDDITIVVAKSIA